MSTNACRWHVDGAQIEESVKGCQILRVCLAPFEMGGAVSKLEPPKSGPAFFCGSLKNFQTGTKRTRKLLVFFFGFHRPVDLPKSTVKASSATFSFPGAESPVVLHWEDRWEYLHEAIRDAAVPLKMGQLWMTGPQAGMI